MKWSFFHILFNKLMTGALIAIFIIPVMADILRAVGVNYGHLMAPIVGGIIFIICFFLYKYFCPEIISRFKTQQCFSNWVVLENINIFEQCKFIKIQSEEEIKNALGRNADILYPIENGLINSREKCQREYSKIEYQLQDKSSPTALFLITIVTVLSIIMINWLAIERLYRILWG